MNWNQIHFISYCAGTLAHSLAFFFICKINQHHSKSLCHICTCHLVCQTQLNSCTRIQYKRNVAIKTQNYEWINVEFLSIEYLLINNIRKVGTKRRHRQTICEMHMKSVSTISVWILHMLGNLQNRIFGEYFLEVKCRQCFMRWSTWTLTYFVS